MPSSTSDDWTLIPTDLHPPAIPKERFEEFPGLKIKEDQDGSWRIKTKENYANSAKPGIRLTLLARGSQFERNGLHLLHQLTPITDFTTREQLANFAELRSWQATLRSEEEPFWSRFVGGLQISLDADLEDKLRAFQSESQETDSLWLVEVDALLSRRLAFMRLMFAQRHTKEAVTANDFAGFPAARALMANLASGFTMYFSPLLLLDSPWVGGALAARPNATIIQLLTEPQPGRPRAWTDQLDSFKPPYAGSAIWSGLATPIENLETREQILRWWASRISELLWIVSDPTRHVDRNGVYEPSIQFGVALTLERIFVTAVEVMCLKTKDEFIRKILLFDFLDLLQGLGMGNYERNLSHTTQHELWVLLKQTLPENVSRTFSPIIDGAFDALLQLDSGFWSAASRTPNNELLIRRKTGIGQDPISLDRARAQYVRVLRNSTHGFSDLANNPRNLSYLANHTAELDNKLPDLVWWYLIRILSNPMEISRFGGTRGN